MKLSELLKDYKPYKGILKNLNNTPISVAGIVESAQGQLISELVRDTESSAVILTYTDAEARDAARELSLYFDEVLYFPEREYIFYNIDTADHGRQHERLSVIARLTESGQRIVTMSVDAAMQYTARADDFLENTLVLKTGGTYEIDELCERLIKMGYVREDMVEGAGQFGIRGEILDIFPTDGENPVRVDFFDNEIEAVKLFDASTQRSIERLDEVKIIPASEIILSSDGRSGIEEYLNKLLRKAKRAKNEELISVTEQDSENIKEKYYFPSIDKFMPLIYKIVPTIFDYLSPTDMVFAIDPKRILEKAKGAETLRAETLVDLKEKNIIADAGAGYYLSYAELIKKAGEKRLIGLDVLSHTKNDFAYKHLETFVTKTTISFHGKIEYLYEDLERYKACGETVVILASSTGRAKNLEGVLCDRGFRAKYSPSAEIRSGEITVITGRAAKGFEYPDLNFVMISDTEIFKPSGRKKSRKIKDANKLNSYNDITPGDYVVHQVHGIGQYVGTQRMTVAHVTKDYLKIKYRGTDVLYVPIDQLDMLYKYVGSSDRELKLNKLGSQEWTNAKKKVKQSTAEMAKKLVALYAERENIKGHAYSADTPWQREFEDEFPYIETEDQLRSVEEVKADLEKQKPMDRLLCGDVGFGKTEVALRAAFKVVNDSKQVAYFCPTTILALQHYETFLKRMEDFPIRVEMLSRFRTPTQTKKILKQLKSGEIDIVIGTHKLLSDNVVFKDLGLLIIDEEQRFGVKHKEKLKELKKSVDVLTMTATPIPRTLHMAMTSVRDMSVLTEPPENRYPVATYVLEENEAVIANAIQNELSRGGQVFYLYNRVSGIYTKAEKLKKRFPDARIAVGHGKMKENELEDIMCDMVDGNIDILVCTTIIETGLDIPNANTMIIEDADKMGLAQLYQLRGRVGRSNRAAYAYFVYKKDKILSEVASKRLRAIREFTEFGSGFKIAMRDLEIRGAGNILGAEQHGHMDTVGYDMYCKLLKESISEIKHEIPEEDITVSVDIEADAYLPEDYIPSGSQRIDIYKKIAAISGLDDKYELEDELRDRYGEIRKPVRNIIELAMLKVDARKAGVVDITQHGRMMTMSFMETVLTPELIWALDGIYPDRIKVTSAQKPMLNFKLKETDKNIIELAKNILSSINELQNDKK